MHYLTRLVEFEASHRYWNPDFSEEENLRTFGKCVSPYGHGHNYVLRVTLAGQIDSSHRYGHQYYRSSIGSLKKSASEFDHKFINLDHPAFHDQVPTQVPTTENLAAYMRDSIEHKLSAEGAGRYHLTRVRLYEEPTSVV